MHNSKIKLNELLPGVIAIFLSLYAYSRSSWDTKLPFLFWMGLLFGCFVLEVVYLVFTGGKVKKDMLSILQITMIIIIVIWNNQSFKYESGFNHKLFVQFLLTLFFLFAIKKERWKKCCIYSMLICGVFYSIWTFAAYFNENVFYNIIYPLVKDSIVDDYYLVQYRLGYMAGLTSHYSTNGMYLTIGVCAAIGFLVCAYRTSNIRLSKKITSIVLVGFIFVALLLTGKRGPVVYIVASIVVWYYYYNSDKKTTRLFKIIAFSVLVIFVLYLLSLFLPGISNVISRFEEMSESGNVSSNRFVLWEQALRAFLGSPVVGKGWYWFKYNNTMGQIYHVHCTYLQWLCELGVVGSIPFFAFTYLVIKRGIYVLKSTKNNIAYTPLDKGIITCSFVFIIFFFLFNVTGTGFYEIQVLVPYIFSAACIESYYIRDNKRTAK